jgi:polyisoprenoid-binding protein YceI
VNVRAVAHLLVGAVVVVSNLDLAATVPVDTQKSTITVRAYKSGFFSAFAHDHEISAPIESGSFSEEEPSVEVAVNAANLKVMDKGSSADERQKIQDRMLGPEVLDTAQFKEIHFRSTKVEPAGDNGWNVTGELTLHGQTHPITFKVLKVNGHYQGKVGIQQTDFGMTPISIAGGSVKVKNQVLIEFDVAGQ